MEAQSCLVLLLETTVTILEIQNFTFVCFFGWQGWKLILEKKMGLYLPFKNHDRFIMKLVCDHRSESQFKQLRK